MFRPHCAGRVWKGSTIHPNTRRGKFGEDYVRVLASAAGLVVGGDDVDIDGVDLTLKIPGAGSRVRSPRIDVQVKTTATIAPSDGTFPFDGLDGRQYNLLAGHYQVPRVLVVVTVPREEDRLTDLTSRGLLLRDLGYFLSLHGRSPVSGTRSSVRVRIPLANVLSAPRLCLLVEELQ